MNVGINSYLMYLQYLETKENGLVPRKKPLMLARCIHHNQDEITQEQTLLRNIATI